MKRNPIKKERPATMADYYRIQADCILWGMEEDRLFYIWYEENRHRLPLRRTYWTEGHKALGIGFDAPMMEDEHFREFAQYMEANWQASVPYKR